jgi:mannose-6-phosphate isomerase-like protein (cupin superfamily)
MPDFPKIPEFPEAVSFKYVKPEVKSGKAVVKLCQTDRMIGIMQVVAKGGETNLHSHPSLDGMWMVMSGRVRFYGPEDKVIGEYGKYEGVLIPRGCPYWFESVGEEEAELLQVEAFDIRIGSTEKLMKNRIDYAQRNRPMESMVESAT